MRAFVQTGYGSADVIEATELDVPVPQGAEVLVRVSAASLAAGDYFLMRGSPFPARFAVGFPKPKKDYVVGLDFAGTSPRSARTRAATGSATRSMASAAARAPSSRWLLPTRSHGCRTA